LQQLLQPFLFARRGNIFAAGRYNKGGQGRYNQYVEHYTVRGAAVLFCFDKGQGLSEHPRPALLLAALGNRMAIPDTRPLINLAGYGN